jgi:MFS family permease
MLAILLHPDGRMRNPRSIFYGWYVAVACGVGLACGLASMVTATFSIFLAPLQAQFGWTRPQLFLALTLDLLVVTGAAPFLGALVDRIGARGIILAGLLLEAVLFASFAVQTASLPALYIRYAALGVLALPTTHVAFSRVISMWFDRRRGLALGIALAGLGIGNMLWPPLVQWTIERFGWREAYLGLAAIIVLVGFSTVALVVRDSPQSMGLDPDGVASGEHAKASSSPAVGMTRREALRTSTFWIVLAAFVLVGVAISSVQTHLVPILTSRGISPMLAAASLSVLAVALVFGRLAAGSLMDRFFAPRVAIGFLLGPILAIALLAAGVTGLPAFLAGVLTGLAVGAEIDVTAYLASRYFGLRHFGAIYAFFYGSFALGSAFGPLFTAIAVDKTGSYRGVLIVHGGLLLAGALLLSRLPRFPKWEDASSSEMQHPHDPAHAAGWRSR